MIKKKFRLLVKAIIPPVFIYIFRRFNGLNDTNPNITYEGIYTNFTEVRDDYLKANFYHTIESLNEVIEEGHKSLKKIQNNMPPNEGMAQMRHNFLPIFISSLGKVNLNILDIGGGYGTAYLHCLYSCLNHKIKSTVVELPSSILEFEKIYTKGEVEFTSSILNVMHKQFDIVYFGSSLQYFEDFERVLVQAASLRSMYIVIADTPMGQFQTFVCAQVNMKNNVIPRLVFSIDELSLILSKQGYKLIHRSVNYYPFHNFDNYSKPISEARHMNIIFSLD